MPQNTGSPDDHGPTLGPAHVVDRQQLEKSVSWSCSEWLRCHWYRLRLTVAEMNYATRRLVELQAPPLPARKPTDR